VREHPIFARLWDSVIRLAGRREREHRAELISGSRGRVLEFGAGTGLNFSLYSGGVRVVGLEPEPTMARKASTRARTARAPVKVLRGSAEALPFRDETFDTAVACCVFCSIADPLRAATEIRRVLRPDGRLLLYEHVRSQHSRWARWQDRLTPLWRRLAAGCHPNRDTETTLRSAGFDVDARRVSVGVASPVRPHAIGVARSR
jgi:SAM-dependent methyltransferase